MIKEEYYGFEKQIFEFDTRNVTVAIPNKSNCNGKWVWRAEFFGAFDYVDKALLEKGWHIIHYDVKNMYGCPESIQLLKKFHNFIVKEYPIENKAAIFGFSRGGLYGLNYAVEYPEDVSVLYLDAPVLDLKSWPMGNGKGQGATGEWEECKSWYNITDETVMCFKENPIDKVDKLIEYNIPTILVAGDSDVVVPYDENGKRMVEIFKQNPNAKFEYIVKPGIGHHPHSLENPSEIVSFIEQN